MTLFVNGEKIDDAVIDAEISRLRPSYQQVFKDQSEAEQEKQLAEWARENVIEAALFQQRAKQSFPEIDPQEIQQMLEHLLENENEFGPLHQQLEAGTQQEQKLRNEIADQIRRDKLSADITANLLGPSEKDVCKYYEQHLDRFTVPEMVHAAHIVKHPNETESKEQQYQQMQEILVSLNKGVSFEEIAKETSDCPDQAGDLGFFARGQMVQAFEDVIFVLEPGTYSGIFETEFGWHIAKLIEKRPSVPCPLEQVHEVIVRDLTQQSREKEIEKYLDAQKEKACIEDR